MPDLKKKEGGNLETVGTLRIPLEFDDGGQLTLEKVKNLLSIGNGLGRQGKYISHILKTPEEGGQLFVVFSEGPVTEITTEEM